MKLRLKNLSTPDSKDNLPKEFKVMLIDDESENIFGIERFLQKEYEVTSFASAVEALKHLKDNPDIEYATILSDHIMPSMTGVEFFTELNRMAHPAPRILLTGFAGLDNVVAAINEAAIYRYLKKPIDTQEVAMVVHESVALFKMTKENKHLINQMEKVLYSHQLHQIKSGKRLEETMPQGVHEACVISFDIVGSSQIKHPEVISFFRRIFARCGDIMRENYDSSEFQANAFRIKEMGDGFLCSVGFPFQCPEGDDLALSAVNLAERFAESFQEEAALENFNPPVYCGLGVAKGAVEGFYAGSHPVGYDLYGRGLVLAKRYEEMRKILFQKLELKGNIIILQESVFEKLPEAKQATYTNYDLASSDLKVRDDKSATKLFYQFISAKK